MDNLQTSTLEASLGDLNKVTGIAVYTNTDPVPGRPHVFSRRITFHFDLTDDKILEALLAYERDEPMPVKTVLKKAQQLRLMVKNAMTLAARNGQ